MSEKATICRKPQDGASFGFAAAGRFASVAIDLKFIKNC
jgi:hypothetical protein